MHESDFVIIVLRLLTPGCEVTFFQAPWRSTECARSGCFGCLFAVFATLDVSLERGRSFLLALMCRELCPCWRIIGHHSEEIFMAIRKDLEIDSEGKSHGERIKHTLDSPSQDPVYTRPPGDRLVSTSQLWKFCNSPARPLVVGVFVCDATTCTCAQKVASSGTRKQYVVNRFCSRGAYVQVFSESCSFPLNQRARRGILKSLFS